MLRAMELELTIKMPYFWYKKAAEQAHPMAQYNLGLMYLIGAGVANLF